MMSAAAAEKILDEAWRFGVRRFDTAAAYGGATERLSEWLEDRGLGSQARVTTKAKVEGVLDVERTIREAIEPLRGCGELTFLTHGYCTSRTWREVVEFCREAGISAGQSVYTPEEALRSAQMGAVLIQAPANVLDWSAVEARGDATVPLELRSVFLQGLLLDSPDRAEQRVPGGGVVAERLAMIGRRFDAPLASLLLAAVMRCARPQDRVVIGVDCAEHLQVLDEIQRVSAEEIDNFRRAVEREMLPVQPEILDPRKWESH